MLKIYVICVGGLKERHWRSAQEEYLTRLRPMARLELIEVPASAITASFTPEKSKAKEAEAILRNIPDNAAVVTLEIQGSEMGSEKLTGKLMEYDESARPICLIIGGTAGLDKTVTDKAEWSLSLSRLTLTHEMARVLLLEQVYRCLMIAAGKKYHY